MISLWNGLSIERSELDIDEETSTYKIRVFGAFRGDTISKTRRKVYDILSDFSASLVTLFCPPAYILQLLPGIREHQAYATPIYEFSTQSYVAYVFLLCAAEYPSASVVHIIARGKPDLQLDRI